MSSVSHVLRPVELGVEVEHFVEDGQARIRPTVRQVDEEWRHLGLPAAVDVGRLHRRLRRREVVGEQVAHQ